MFYLYNYPILHKLDIKAQIMKDLIKFYLWDLHKSRNYLAKIQCFLHYTERDVQGNSATTKPDAQDDTVNRQ